MRIRKTFLHNPSALRHLPLHKGGFVRCIFDIAQYKLYVLTTYYKGLYFFDTLTGLPGCFRQSRFLYERAGIRDVGCVGQVE